MIKYKANCAVCRACKDDKKIVEEIYSSTFYMKNSGPSLAMIQDRHRKLFSYDSLKNHVKKHQFLSDEDYTKRSLAQISRKHEKLALKRAVESKHIWEEVMEIGLEGIKSGDIPLRAGDVLKAAKDKSDYVFKQKDQEMAMIDMIAHFASGENDAKESAKYDRRIIEGQAATNIDTPEESARDAERRENESRAFYQRIIGDAAPPGAD